MSDAKPVDIISDAPEEKSPVFGFDAYARTIAGLIANKENKTPLVIGIYGPWGSGKTTLMKTVKQMLDNKKKPDEDTYRICKTVWFQAWKYNEEDEILAALIEEIFKTMKKDGFLEACKAEVEKLVNMLNPFKIFGRITKETSGVDLADYISEMEYKSKLGFYDTFQEFFDRLIWTYTNLRPKLTSTEKPNDKKGALVIFIDDLDRCLQEKIIKILETIKLFMDKKGCIFVIGAANDIIEKALKEKYEDDDAAKFMDKIVQVTFNLPQVPEPDFKTYIEKINPSLNKEIAPHLPSIMTAIHYNPRRLKRFLNNINLLAGILSNKNIQIGFSSLLTLSIIEYVYPLLWNDIKDNPQILSTLKKNISEVESKLEDGSLRDITDELMEEAQVPRSLRKFIQNKDLVEIVKNFTGNDEDIHQLITLSGIVESAEEAKIRQVEKIRVSYDDMVEVPDGDFLYGDEKITSKIEKPFLIDVYPVTNARYEKFIKEDGYENGSYWDKEGLKWKKKYDITRPKYWKDDEWKQPEHPVVGVSYYEANAYALWAIPTEEQWERAARGTDGREYPWGNDFDKGKCNVDESGIGKTTRVTRYPNGVSPVGCYDMAGNVLEWTQSYYDKSKDMITLRGGSWGSFRNYARCAGRNRYLPYDRFFNIGFRCVRTLK